MQHKKELRSGKVVTHTAAALSSNALKSKDRASLTTAPKKLGRPRKHPIA